MPFTTVCGRCAVLEFLRRQLDIKANEWFYVGQPRMRSRVRACIELMLLQPLHLLLYLCSRAHSTKVFPVSNESGVHHIKNIIVFMRCAWWRVAVVVCVIKIRTRARARANSRVTFC